MPEYRAIRPCYHGRKFYKVGDILFATKDEKVPRHFVPSPTFSPQAVKAAEEADRVEKRVNIKAQKAGSK